MTLAWLTSWWNLIFILPFALGLMYLGLYTISGWTFGDGEAELELDHDVDVDAHLDIDGDVHADINHDLSQDVDHDADSDTGGHPSALLAVLNWIGIGQVPLSLVMMVQMLSWGVIGFVLVQLLRGWPIARFAPTAMIAAGVGSTTISQFVSSILGPTLFKAPNTARRYHQLLGSRGHALYPIDSAFGMVGGRDDRGELFQVSCRTADGQPPIAKGVCVKLVAFTAKDRMFHVIPDGDTQACPP